jgi:hypothetical protein
MSQKWVSQSAVILFFYVAFEMICYGISAVEIRSESSFRRGNLTNLLVTDRLLRIHDGVESSIHCSILCLDESACVSFFYSPLPSACRLHSITLGKVSDNVTDIGSQYFVLQKGNLFLFLFSSLKLFKFYKSTMCFSLFLFFSVTEHHLIHIINDF